MSVLVAGVVAAGMVMVSPAAGAAPAAGSSRSSGDVVGAAAASDVAGGVVRDLPGEDPAGGDWYFTRFGVQQAHDQGWTGKGVKVAVIDSVINPDLPHLKGAKLTVREPSFCFDEKTHEPIPAAGTSYDQVQAGHGTNVTSMIVGTGAGFPGQKGARGVAPGVQVRFYANGVGKERDALAHNSRCAEQQGEVSGESVSSAMREAVDDGAQIISISQVSSSSPELIAAIAHAIREGVVVVAGLSNTGELDDGFLATANGVVSVQAIHSSGEIQSRDGLPNADRNVDVAGPGLGIRLQGSGSGPDSWRTQRSGNGTSFATPVVAGFLALVKQKYPKATGNQLIQSLVRNSGDNEHKPEWNDRTGYGIVSLTRMLERDPTRYPDKNPLVSEKPDVHPNLAEIAAADPGGGPSSGPGTLPATTSGSTKAGGSKNAASTDAAPKTVASSGLSGGLLGVLVGVGVLVVAGAVVIAIVVSRRASRPGRP